MLLVAVQQLPGILILPVVPKMKIVGTSTCGLGLTGWWGLTQKPCLDPGFGSWNDVFSLSLSVT